jgi:hypothetical protein
MILTELDLERWGVSKVNPWAYGDPDSVVSDLLAAVTAALPKGKLAKRARDALVRYGVFAAPLLSVVPLVGSSLKDLGKEALTRLSRQATLQEQTEQVALEFSRLGRPLLIVVDDVDRLQPDELIALFRAIRVLGHMPNVHYLLAYDEQTVLDVLRTTPTAAGRDERAVVFLEKVVTMRLDQPPIRPSQAESMFNIGLRDTLAASNAYLTDSQELRLAYEYTELLARTLAEPRSVSRFLAQLRIYFPLVGIAEVDVVDFIVLTHLRARFPRLYRALAADRMALVGAPQEHTEDPLASWRETEHLKELGVPEQDVHHVGAALRRLFPKIDEESIGARLVALSLRRERRIADPDYVERYFALIQPAEDVPDAILIQALREWGAGNAGPAATRIMTVLHPDRNDQAGCTLAASVLRRADSYSETLSHEQIAQLIQEVVALVPNHLPISGDPWYSRDSAAIAWLARLLRQTDGLAPKQLLDLVERPPTVTSPLNVLLHAIRLATPEPFEENIKPTAASLRPWMSQIIEAATEATWQRFISNVQLGNTAPPEPAGWLLRWLNAVLGTEELNARLSTGLDGGIPLADLAARWVDVGTNLASGQLIITGFDPSPLLRRLGLRRVEAARAALTTAAGSDGRIDEDDTTWENRRKLAARMLLDALDRADREPRSLLPVVAHRDSHPFTNHRPAILGAPGGEEPDLYAQLSVLLPADSSLLSHSAPMPPPNRPTGAEREDTFLSLIATSPITQWLDEVAEQWHIKPGTWKVTYSDARSVTTVAATAHTTEAAAGGWRQQTPVLLAAQIRTGLATPEGGGRASQLLTIAVGMSIGELTSDRRPDSRSHSESPMPAALSLDELYQLIRALVRSTRLAGPLYRQLADSSHQPAEPLIHLSIQPRPGLAAVVDLRDLKRIGAGHHGMLGLAFDVSQPPYGAEPAGEDLDAITVGFLSECLLRAGYREYEHRLRELWMRLPNSVAAPEGLAQSGCDNPVSQS